MNSNERRSVEDTFSVALDNSRVEPLFNASQHNVDQNDKTALSSTSQLSAFSRSFDEDQITDLHSCLIKESLNIRKLIQVYFAEIHPYWPILHAPTFDTENAPHVLLGSMIMLVSWLKGELDHMKLASLVFDAVNATLLIQKCFPCHN